MHYKNNSLLGSRSNFVFYVMMLSAVFLYMKRYFDPQDHSIISWNVEQNGHTQHYCKYLLFIKIKITCN